MIGATLGVGLARDWISDFPTEVREMTEEIPSAQASPPPPPIASGSAEVLPDILARLSALESAVVKDFGPKILALEEAIESLASRAESYLPTSIVAELSELKMVVASLGGGITGATGHDAAKFFHTWWDKITGKVAPAPSATQSAAGASVTNSGPLAAGGAPIPLSGK